MNNNKYLNLQKYIIISKFYSLANAITNKIALDKLLNKSYI